jgi:hypothetical protein
MQLRFLLTIFLISFNLTTICSQWKFFQVNDPFDGLYEYGKISGVSDDSTYRKPILYVANSANRYDFNIYIGNIGYTGCSYSSISVVFQNDNEVLEFDSSSNLDNDVAFLDLPSLNPKKYSFRYIPIFNDVSRSGPSEDELIKFKKLINLLRTKERIYMRYRSNCGTINIEFSLAGINSILNNLLANQLNDLEDYFRNEQKRVLEEYVSKKRENESNDSIRENEKRLRDSLLFAVKRKERQKDSLLNTLETDKRANKLKPLDRDILSYISKFNSSAKSIVIPYDNMVKYEIQSNADLRITATKTLNDKGKIKSFDDEVSVTEGSIIWVYPSVIGNQFKVVIYKSEGSQNPSFHFGLMTPKAISVLETKIY